MSRYHDLALRLRSDDLTLTELADGSGVVLHLQGGEIYSLNETGMFLVDRLCRGEHDPRQLTAAMAQHFQVDLETAHRDLEQFTCELFGLLCQ